MLHHLEQTLLHYVRTRFTDQLVVTAEDQLEIVGTHTWVEIVCVLSRGSDPLAQLFVISHTGTCGDYSHLLVLV